LITIPPKSWITTCRRHGVQILGTLITEWETGKQICQQLFQTKKSAQDTAELLLHLARETQLHGWLINLENQIPVELIDNLKLFLTILTNGMHGIERDDEEKGVRKGYQERRSYVIWYDAVTIEGELRWQDSLSLLNKPFFDVCDGIFINYTWKENSITTTLQSLAGYELSFLTLTPLCQPLVLVGDNDDRTRAYDREEDVFYGIDVFGRNCIGGYDCCESIRRLCLDEMKESKFSIALFAPGWVMETQIKEPEPSHVLINNQFTNKTILHRLASLLTY
jgi:mannosyl-glycoprotein endo-beta-N-acetylglucosaminidase